VTLLGIVALMGWFLIVFLGGGGAATRSRC
jgi:hypothetical protein